MASEKRTANAITEGVIWQQLLLFFFPILLGTFFQQLYNTADAMIVGRFVGKEALSAVGGTTNTIINLLIGFFVGLSSGATVIISQFFGARQREDVSRAVHTSVALAIAGGIVLTVVGIVSAPGRSACSTHRKTSSGTLRYTCASILPAPSATSFSTSAAASCAPSATASARCTC